MAVGLCVTSVSCAVVSAGISVDASLIAKDVQSYLDFRHEEELRKASQQQARILQHRLDEERALKQVLQVQKSTQQWQDQRKAQLALQEKSTAASANPIGVSGTTKPTVPPIATKPGPIGTSTAAIGSPASIGTPGTAGKSAPVVAPVNTGPSSPIGQSQIKTAPIIIKVPGIVDGRPAMVDMPLSTGSPLNPSTSTLLIGPEIYRHYYLDLTIRIDSKGS